MSQEVWACASAMLLNRAMKPSFLQIIIGLHGIAMFDFIAFHPGMSRYYKPPNAVEYHHKLVFATVSS